MGRGREKESVMGAIAAAPTGRGLLEGKNAVIYGAAGGIGKETAKAFAREGATVHLAGRTIGPLRSLAEEIVASGGSAETAQVDALDEASVENHLKEIVRTTGRLDISYNLISTYVAMGAKLIDLSVDRFVNAAFTRARSYFITSTAAARLMQLQRSGVILGLTPPISRLPQGEVGGFAVGCGAIETLLKQLALEVGPLGVRVVCLRTGATPENPVLQEVYRALAQVRGTTARAIEDAEAQRTALKRAPRIAEVANAAVLIASDYASAITATPINASCGELVD
jgi:NAD(P)-dependent dehydrogenase (short-subunit alcohol dehydrogenase family)